MDQSLKPQPTGEDVNHRPAPGGTKPGKKPKTEKLKKENSGEFEGVGVKLPLEGMKIFHPKRILNL